MKYISQYSRILVRPRFPRGVEPVKATKSNCILAILLPSYT